MAPGRGAGGSLALYKSRPSSRTAGPAAGRGSGEPHEGQEVILQGGWTGAGRAAGPARSPGSPHLQYSFLNSGSQGNRWVSALCPSVTGVNTRQTSSRTAQGLLLLELVSVDPVRTQPS